MIIQQLLRASEQTREPIPAVCDDTDVFLLLIHFCNSKRLVHLERTHRDGKIININDSIIRHEFAYRKKSKMVPKAVR